MLTAQDVICNSPQYQAAVITVNNRLDNTSILNRLITSQTFDEYYQEVADFATDIIQDNKTMHRSNNLFSNDEVTQLAVSLLITYTLATITRRIEHYSNMMGGGHVRVDTWRYGAAELERRLNVKSLKNNHKNST